MILLILGLALWAALHLMRAVAPQMRQGLTDRFGVASKGIVGAGIIVSVVLMVLGYRAADFIPVWTPPSFFGHINNLLMILAFYLYLTTAVKPGVAYVFGNLKNPQLAGFKVWALAHLLANGDLASILLFGGLLAWAVAEVIVSRPGASLVNRETAPISNPAVHLALTVLVIAVVATLHIWWGPNPFGGV